MPNNSFITIDPKSMGYCVSPYYWENNNPSAISFTSETFDTVGNEILGALPKDVKLNPTDFDHDVLDTVNESFAFRKFINNGQKFGCINITNAKCWSFNHLKEMYGSVVYIVFENKSLNENDPRLKRGRHIMFINEYDLCALNSRLFLSDEAYYSHLVNNSKYESLFTKTLKKLYRNGFVFNKDYPSQIQYFSSKDVERLESQDLMNLLWKLLCSFSPSQKNNDNKFVSAFAQKLYSCNIIGFGWMPCLVAKEKYNELDNCILDTFNKLGVISTINEIKSKNEQPFEFQIGKRGIVSFQTDSEQMKLPLHSIMQIKECGNLSKITCKSGLEYKASSVSLVDDIPTLTFKKDTITSDINVVATYAGNEIRKYVIDAFRDEDISFDSYVFQNYLASLIPGYVCKPEYETQVYADLNSVDTSYWTISDSSLPNYVIDRAPVTYISTSSPGYASIGTNT